MDFEKSRFYKGKHINNFDQKYCKINANDKIFNYTLAILTFSKNRDKINATNYVFNYVLSIL